MIKLELVLDAAVVNNQFLHLHIRKMTGAVFCALAKRRRTLVVLRLLFEVLGDGRKLILILILLRGEAGEM